MPRNKRAKDRPAADGREGPAEVEDDDQPATAEICPLVGLGASAGGLKALKEFFSEVTEDSGLAYVVVVHLTPGQPSMMPDLLQKATPIPVSVAEDGQAIEPNRAYVIPPDKEISIFKGVLQLLNSTGNARTLPIDSFLRSLAQDQESNAAAVILSGTGTDGTLGVREIKSHHGVVLVQAEESADYDGMPRSAASTGLADLILPPDQMPQKLARYFTHTAQTRGLVGQDHQGHSTDRGDWLNKVFAVLRSRVGHDFSAYKKNTIWRRIDRRMGLNQIDSHDVYVSYLRENPEEVDALFRELLIGVTSFFRDDASFAALEESGLPELIEEMPANSTLRVWVPGCSTGEEAYSLSIVLREFLDSVPRPINLQLFGTDIDEQAIEKARQGLFPSSISGDVGQEHLRRFFVREGDNYRILKSIRDSVVFSVQDVLRDPPFSRLSLLCCRNLLIYFGSEAQKQLLPLFHHALVPGGILMLGSSETIGGFTNLFTPLNKKWKIFKRIEVPRTLRPAIHFPSGTSMPERSAAGKPTALPAPPGDLGELARKAILDQFTPAAVLVDAQGSVLHVQGRVGTYLEPPSGPPTHNILDLAREGLRIELSSALRTARNGEGTVIRRGVAVKTNGDTQVIDLHVRRQTEPHELSGRFLVVFVDVEAAGSPAGPGISDEEGTIPGEPRVRELERELQLNRETHQTTMEELESSNEELKSTNEELQSSNEELQSTNEELESSKEELQSLNEELQTVNAEMQSKMEELSAARDDMRNLLNGTEIATIFVDNSLRVRRFTSEATAIVNLIETDIGRPLEHVMSNLVYDRMITDLREVLEQLIPKDVEVQTTRGVWYSMRIVPYRTTDNRIGGAVLTFACIEDQKIAQETLRASIREFETARVLVRTVFDMHTDPMLVLDGKGRMVIANSAFSELAQLPQEEIEGRDLLALADGEWQCTDLAAQLRIAMKEDADIRIESVSVDLPGGGSEYSVRGRVIPEEDDLSHRIFLHFSRVT